MTLSRSPRAAVRPDSGDDTGCTVLHVDMDCFFAAVEVLDHPELASRPVVVGGTVRGVVTSATYEARAFGIHAAMPVSRARRLCPGAVFLPVRHQRYGQVSREVMAVLESITPQVERVSIDEAFLDVRGALRRLGPPSAIGELIRRRVRDEVGVAASVGVAATRHVAKLASTNAKPDGMLVIPVAETVHFLHALPVGALWGVGEHTRTVLESKGLRTVGQLAETPVTSLARWVGVAGATRLHELSWGRDSSDVQPHRAERSIGTEVTFGSDVSDRAELEKTLLRQAHECAARLRDGGLEAGRVSLKVRFRDFTTITRSRALPAPSQVGGELAATARDLLASVRIPPGGVRLVGLRAEALVEASRGGLHLTLDGSVNQHRAETAMDDVRRRFGPTTVEPASLLRPGEGRADRA